MKRGFTILELMIVIAIIMILAAIVVPPLVGITQKTSSDDIVIMDKSEIVNENNDIQENTKEIEDQYNNKWDETENRY